MVDQAKPKRAKGEEGRAKEGAANPSSLFATVAESASLEVPVLTSLFSSKPRPTELGKTFSLGLNDTDVEHHVVKGFLAKGVTPISPSVWLSGATPSNPRLLAGRKVSALSGSR